MMPPNTSRRTGDLAVFAGADLTALGHRGALAQFVASLRPKKAIPGFPQLPARGLLERPQYGSAARLPAS